MTEPSTSFDSPWKDIVETYLPEFFGLFVTLYAKLTDKMPRQPTFHQKIPKVSKAIASSSLLNNPTVLYFL